MGIQSKRNSKSEMALYSISERIGVINLGLGNVTSVQNCLKSANLKSIITRDLSELANCRGYVLPGVGTASALMKQFREYTEVMTFVKEIFQTSEKPMLTICLGMQILFEKSEEGETDCLGLMRGNVKKLDNNLCNIGWRNLDLSDIGVNQRASFYFNHSYYVDTERRKNTLKIEIGDQEACVAARVRNTLSLQFHPEKSQKSGVDLVKSFFEPNDA